MPSPTPTGFLDTLWGVTVVSPTDAWAVGDYFVSLDQTLIIATDEEGGDVDRLAPYYGPSSSPQQLAASGDPRQAYAQGQLDAQHLLASGINTDFVPLADVYQGGAVDQSRMFGTTPPAGHYVCRGVSRWFTAGRRRGNLEALAGHWLSIGQSRLWAADH